MFRLPTKTLIARGARQQLVDLIKSHKWQKAALIIDAALLHTPCGEDILRIVEGMPSPPQTINDFSPNPRCSETETTAKCIKDSGADVVIAMGGGSALDMAKAAAMLATNDGSARDYLAANSFANTPLPFVAIPTTCGTGSEVTWVSVLTEDEGHRKISVKGDGMFPDYALVDADTLATLPPTLIAATGMDALTHALEAIISRPANSASDALALDACRRIFTHIESAAAGQSEAQEEMMTASVLAGMAFGNADVAGVHCLSESIGGLCDTPHGLTNAILLAPVFEYQLAEASSKLAWVARMLWQEKTDELSEHDAARLVLAKIKALNLALSLPAFASLGVKNNQIDQLARMAEENGSNASNPRDMSRDDYKTILLSLI